jgi:hypothetical protein
MRTSISSGDEGAGGSCQPLPRSAYCFRRRFKIHDIAICDDIARQDLNRIAIDPTPPFSVNRQLDHLDRRRTNIEPDQGARLGIEDRKIELQITTPQKNS